MTLQINNKWPLVIVNPVNKGTLRQKSISHLPAQNPPEPRILDRPPVRKSDTSFEKGVFVDIYA